MTKETDNTTKPAFFEGPSQPGSLGFTLLYQVGSIKKDNCKKITENNALDSSPSNVVFPHSSPSI